MIMRLLVVFMMIMMIMMIMIITMMCQVATGEFHSLIVTGDGWSPGSPYRFLIILGKSS